MARPLKRVNQRIVFLERKRQSRMTQGHKREIHERTILGGLIIKAGLKNADRAFLLGALIEASQVPVGTIEHARLCALGAEAFRAEARARIKL